MNNFNIQLFAETPLNSTTTMGSPNFCRKEFEKMY